jgi:putative restriction endonuclease
MRTAQYQEMKAVLTTKPMSPYDDVPEIRYHFPKTYLRQARDAVGDLVVYYEPRRSSGDDASRGGRQSYFAVARLERIEEDRIIPDHYYAYITEYLSFDSPVPFSPNGKTIESALQKADGSTNRGAFGRSVRSIPDEEFLLICSLGFHEFGADREDSADSGSLGGLEEPSIEFERPRTMINITRPLRDRAFTRQIQAAYGQRCAFTGLRLINGGGRSEAQAAHIRPVHDKGPDSVRNGLALSGTVHWMFDRGLISIADDYRILKASSLPSEDVNRLLNPTGRLLIPDPEYLRPHPHFLRYHRESIFKG